MTNEDDLSNVGLVEERRQFTARIRELEQERDKWKEVAHGHGDDAQRLAGELYELETGLTQLELQWREIAGRDISDRHDDGYHDGLQKCADELAAVRRALHPTLRSYEEESETEQS